MLWVLITSTVGLLMSTHNICFHGKIKKNMYLLQTHNFHVHRSNSLRTNYFTFTCIPDA